jgi:glutamine cyclotransferase
LELQGLGKLTFELKTKIGLPNLKALVYYEGENSEATARVELVSSVQPKLLKYKIVNTHPHDTTSFTEGLSFTMTRYTKVRGKTECILENTIITWKSIQTGGS